MKINLNERYLTSLVKKTVDSFINEELSISDKVVEETNKIKELIKKDSGASNKEVLDDGVFRRTGSIRVSIFSTNFLIKYEIINFVDYDTYYEKYQLFKPNCSTSMGNKEMKISILSISGEFQENSFGDSIQHEVEHIYQEYMAEKPLFYNDDKDIYRTAIENINSTLYNGWVSKLSNVVYYSKKYEQDAFINGLYQQLVQPDAIFYEKDIIKSSTPYKISVMLVGLRNEIDKNIEDKDLINACKFFGKPSKWFINRCDSSCRYIAKRLRKVITKARKDYHTVNEGVSVKPFL